MHDKLLLVGSIPYDTPEEVFRTFGPALGEHLPFIPDGEIGERRYWIDGLAYRAMANHRELETLHHPSPRPDGVEEWRPQGIHDEFKFRVRPGITKLRFGDPGWRLGYTRDAVNSYFVFKTLRKEGVLPQHMRFQVCLPAVWSGVVGFFPDQNDWEKVIPGATEAFAAEVAEMCRQIPAEDLAIQWDLAIENRFVEPVLAMGDMNGARAMARRMAEPMAEICNAIPRETLLGHHSCFGTLNGWPSRQPPSLLGTVIVLNEMIAAGKRPVDFLHFPTVGSSADDFFAPLSDLDRQEARVYAGAIHHMHGADGMRAQLLALKKYLPDFGLAAPCGFGRVPEKPGRLLTDQGDKPPPDYIQVILDDHRKALEVLASIL
ncbi:MAG: hypothetical protein AB7F96_18780 [Beijerinckiaceae bacterium]